MKIPDLTGKAVAILATDGFEYVELVAPLLALKAAGARVEIVSLRKGRIRGVNLTLPTATIGVDRSIDETDVDAYDALFIPGGLVNPDLLRQSAAARTLVRAFHTAHKPIATICHGPWVLVSAEVVRGRTFASWPSVRDDIVHAGGIWRDEPVVVDEGFLSSRGPQDLPLFIPALIAFVAGEARQTANDGAGSSAPATEPVPLELHGAHWLPGPAVWWMLGAAVGAGGYALALKLRERRAVSSPREARRSRRRVAGAAQASATT